MVALVPSPRTGRGTYSNHGSWDWAVLYARQRTSSASPRVERRYGTRKRCERLTDSGKKNDDMYANFELLDDLDLQQDVVDNSQNADN